MINKKLGIAGLALAAMVVGQHAEAAEKVVWNWALYGPPRAFSKPIELVAKHVEEKSGGNFTFRIHYSESISPAKEMIDGIKIGAFEGALLNYGYTPGKTPLALAPQLPFLPLPNLEVTQGVIEDFNAWEPQKAEFRQWNAMNLYAALVPQYEVMGKGEPPYKLEDWKGRRVRATGPMGDAMRTIGVVPTSVTVSEAYTAMERGIIDAMALPFSYAFGTYKLHEVSRWYTENLTLGFINNSWAVHIPSYEKLPAEYKAMLEEVRAAQYQVIKDAYEEEDKKWIPIYEERGLKKVVFTPEMKEELVAQGGKPVWEAWVKENEAKGLPAREALDLILASAKKHGG